MCSVRRNFGFGRNIDYAVSQALRAMYGDGSFATRHAHMARWRVFSRFLKGKGVHRFEHISAELVEEYARLLAAAVSDGITSVSYAVNILSTVNVASRAVRGDSRITVSPSRFIGKRRCVREDSPDGLHWDAVVALSQTLDAKGLPRAARAVLLARACGMRLREALLANIPRLRHEASEFGRINIVDGTKGGRRAERWIRVDERVLHALAMCGDVRNLLECPKSLRLRKVYRGEVARAREIMAINGVGGYHELRASWACSRYEEITGREAPAVCESLLTDDLDKEARSQIAKELGHGRPSVSSAYVGRGR